MHYVVCLAFDEAMQHVVLLTKTSGPEAVVGLHNGPGGKVERDETSHEAARREFREETGVDVEDWDRFCTLHWESTEDVVEFFWARTDRVAECRTVTDEPVFLAWVEALSGLEVVPNLRWMIPFLADRSVTKHRLGVISMER